MTRRGQDVASVPLGEMTRAFARIGFFSFGGPAGQIALLHRVVVEEKRWLDEARFLHALNYCMLLPGPEAMQLATYCGWLMHGVRGGLVAGLLFLLPGAALMLVLSALYLAWGEVPVVQGVIFGLKAAVLAIVLEALVKVSRRAVKGPFMAATAITAFVAIAFLQVPFPLIVLGAALLGTVAHIVLRGRQEPAEPVAAAGADERGGPAALARTGGTWLAIWLGPLVLLLTLFGGGNVFVQQAAFFSTMAAVTFGGAYAVLAYVAQQAVEVHAWLMPDEMLTGLGLAETTPGPLVLVLVFVGFLGAARQSGLDPFIGGLAGGAVTLWFTFAPSFLFIFAGAPFVERARHLAWLAEALRAVTAAVVGVIANLALWFALHMLFGTVREMEAGPFRILVPDAASFDPAAALLAALAAVALIRLRLGMPTVLVAAGAAGMAWRLLAD